MLSILLHKWNENKDVLTKNIKAVEKIGDIEYIDLVKLTFSSIYNNGGEIKEYSYKQLNCEDITEIDNGHYQGTLLYLIPFDTYQPDESEYLMTYIGYGSCSVCDTLRSIVSCSDERATDTQVKDLIAVCKDIITNTVKPYNHGWRHSYLFDTVTVADGELKEVE